MSVSADVEVYRPYTFGSALISALFFITPVVTTAVPRVTWLFFPLIAFSLILPAVRRAESDQVIQPNSALIACSLVAGYILLNEHGLQTPALLLARACCYWRLF